jgi:hypothetical protein
MSERLGIGRRREHQRQDDGQGDRKVTAAHVATATLPAGSDAPPVGAASIRGERPGWAGRFAYAQAMSGPIMRA